jgi:transcriptional regulator with XRE-family HTH domain
MSQERLGEALGLTFQQVQKYERGVNRVGASRLFDLSKVMDVPISFFFDDMPDSATPKGTVSARGLAGNVDENTTVDDTMGRRETLELVRSYYRISDVSVRRKLLELVKTMGSTDHHNALS